MTRPREKPRSSDLESYLDRRISCAIQAAYSPAVSVLTTSTLDDRPLWYLMLGDECVGVEWDEEQAISYAQRIDAGLEQALRERESHYRLAFTEPLKRGRA